MLNIVIFGAPGSGKGTQSEKIAKELGLVHISTGAVLREEISKGSDLGKIAKNYIEKGQLLPDSIIIDVLSSVLDNRKPEKGVIFDGFPRTIPQAEALEKILKERGTDVSVMLELQVPEEELMGRMLKRGKMEGRSDDNEETIQSRFSVYKSQTKPLIDYYKKLNKHCGINGLGSVDDIFNRIKVCLEKDYI